ncbi:MAG: hypothetical protein J7577_23035 [Sphingobacteriaceae bacterium]|nr:hypothetical protein [Sphingobacteriaceae bacterium]
MKLSTLTIVVTFILPLSANAQRVLDRTEIDSWPKDNKTVNLDDSYDRASSYLYVLNKQKFLDLFNGIEYTREEQKALGIKKDDKSNFLSLTLDIQHKNIAAGEKVIIPLLMYDFSVPEKTTASSGNNGMIFSDVKVSELKTNILGKVNVKAMIRNSSTAFWKDIASIAADLGKSATSISMGDPKGIMDLTGKLTTHLNTGFEALNKLSNGTREENHSFYIDLVDRGASSDFDEKVIAARLYQVHWLKDKNVKLQDFFKKIPLDNKLTPKKFQEEVFNTNLPLVLVIETRSKTKINKGNPVFTADYKKEIDAEYSNAAQESFQLLKEYNENFTTAYNASQAFEIYNSSATLQTPNWAALINGIDLVYQFRTRVAVLNSKYSAISLNQDVKTRYAVIKSRYETIDNLMTSTLQNQKSNYQMETANNSITTLLNPISLNSSIENLYGELAKLEAYDAIVKNVSSVNKPTSLSYQQYTFLKGQYESALLSKLTQNSPSNSAEKVRYYEDILNNYTLCKACLIDATTKLPFYIKQTLTEVRDSYQDLTVKEYQDFNECRKAIEAELVSAKKKLENLDDLEKTIGNRSIAELDNNLRIWKEYVGKDSATMTKEDIARSIAILKDARKIINEKLISLRTVSLVSKDVCVSPSTK